MMLTLNGKEQYICDLARYHLTSFSRYDEKQSVIAKIHKNGLSIGYGVGRIHDSTRFDMQIIENTCYILWIGIEKEHRKIGLGRSLVNIIEKICGDLHCSTIELTSSGIGKEIFWKKLGFQKRFHGDIPLTMEKKL